MPKQEMPTERPNSEEEQIQKEMAAGINQEQNIEAEEKNEKLFTKENIFSEQFIKEQKKKERPVVAFDVDETILYIKKGGLLKEDWVLRPGVKEAFNEINAKADIILWTSSDKKKMKTMLEYFPFLKENINLIITRENYVFPDNDYTNNQNYKFLYEQVKNKYQKVLNIKNVDDYPKPKDIKKFIIDQPSVLKEAERLLKKIKNRNNQKQYQELILYIFQHYLDEIVQCKNGGIVYGENAIVVDNVYGARSLSSLNLFPFYPIDGRTFIIQDTNGLSEEDIKLLESFHNKGGGMEEIKNEILQILQKQEKN